MPSRALRFRIWCMLLAVQIIPVLGLGAQNRIYLAPDDHTDYMWAGSEADYSQAFVNDLDYYLNLNDATAANPSPYQSRWNCDCWLWMYDYQQQKSAADFQRLIDAIRSGHVSVPLNCIVEAYGGTPLEGVIRGSFYPGQIERQYNLQFPLAVCMENAGMPYGLGAIWAGEGAKYSWKGWCGNIATKIQNVQRPNEIYWWTGPDGSRILMKWYTLYGSNQSLGGYAEAYDPQGAINAINTTSQFLTHYPYSVFGAFGYGWDYLQRTPTNSFPTVAQTNSNASQQVIVSNEQDFFDDFAATYGSSLPSQSCSFGNEWDLYPASMAEVTSSVRRAVEKLRGSEALATLVSQKQPDFMSAVQPQRDAAWLALGKYWDHTWTADSPVISRSDRAVYDRGLAASIKLYPDTLQNSAASTLGSLISNPGYSDCYYVFNPLGWTRTDYADLPANPAAPYHVIDLSTQQEAPAQSMTVEGNPVVRILASGVPSAGYKLYAILSGAGQGFSDAVSINGGTMNNGLNQVTLASRGAISSLQDLQDGSKEYIRVINGYQLNDLGSGSGTLSVANSGPVSATLVATSSAPLQHTSAVTLFRGLNRIEIRNEITQNFSDVRSWSFNFNITNPDVWHEEVGAIVRAKLTTNGGIYSPTNMRYDWLTLNHFVDMSGSDGSGVTLSNADCSFMKLGNSTTTNLDTQTPSLDVLAGGQVDGSSLGIPGQNGDSDFLQRFALQPHSGAFDPAQAMRFALEHQNPLIAGAATGGNGYQEDSYSFATIDNPNVLLWALKPAEDGASAGTVVRLWNVSSQAQDVQVNFPGRTIVSAKNATHIEVPTGDAVITNNELVDHLAPQQIRTYIMQLGQMNGAKRWQQYK